MRSLANLHEYQKEAIGFIKAEKAVNLWMGLGLGKTITTLTAIADLIDGMMINQVIVIAPLRVANSVWAQEANTWEHTRRLTFSIATGPEKNRLSAFHQMTDVTVINRENVAWLVQHWGNRWPYDMIVVDESTSFKSSTTKRWKALKKVAPLSEYRVLLTGTPSPNGLLDVWAQQYLIDFGYALGKYFGGYKNRYFKQDYSGYKWTPAEGSEALIHQAIGDNTLSMESKDYIDVPDRVDIIETVSMPPTALKRYREFEKELLIELDNQVVEAVNAAVLTGKLIQWANGAIYTDEFKNWTEVHTSKLESLNEIIEDNDNENIIVAYYFQSDLKRIKAKFPDAVVLDQDPKTIDRWNNGEIKLLLAHPASAGHGLNLQQGGSVIVWFSLTWSLELYQQFNARLHRQGQKNTVRVVHLIADGTIDNQVLDVLKGKASVQQALIEAMKKLDMTAAAA